MRTFTLLNLIQLLMDKIIFEYFPSISAQQWKQKIQYMLKGSDYQQLVKVHADGISTLPFYTQKNIPKKIDYQFCSTPKPTFYIVVVNEIEANKQALNAIREGVTTIFFAVFSPKIDLTNLLLNINCMVFFQCYFLDDHFNTTVFQQKKNTFILNECLNKISKTGNWYKNVKEDFNTLEKIRLHNNNAIAINVNIFHNAGATPVQQLSYSASQLVTYAKKKIITHKTPIVYNVAVATNFFMEIAKIKALRILHFTLANKFNLNPNCIIIQQKSKRNLSGLFNQINQTNTFFERHIGILSKVDYYASNPVNFYFYKEDIPSTTSVCKALLSASKNTNSFLTEGSVYIEKLTQQLYEKSLSLLDNIEVGGGYIAQLKRGIIQHKITDSEVKETHLFKQSFNFNINDDFKNKKSINYPFLKFKKRKTLWEPIIEKQLGATIERPIWETYFENR